MKNQALEAKTVKELRVLAKKFGVAGATRLRKMELVRAIVKAEGSLPRGAAPSKAKARRAAGKTRPRRPARVAAPVLERSQQTGVEAPPAAPIDVVPT